MDAQRLMNVVRALRESPDPDLFDMGFYGYHCGTPACAAGHYAHRKDLQSTFALNRFGGLQFAGGTAARLEDLADHFALTIDQAEELFDESGCGYAETTTEAADYIEGFVRRGGK